jgi:hypothetical protein
MSTSIRNPKTGRFMKQEETSTTEATAQLSKKTLKVTTKTHLSV